jgi:hypothetical protein
MRRPAPGDRRRRSIPACASPAWRRVDGPRHARASLRGNASNAKRGDGHRRSPGTMGFVHALLDATRLAIGAGAFLARSGPGESAGAMGRQPPPRDTSGECAVGVSEGAVDAWRLARHRPSLIAIVSIANRRPRGSRPSLIVIVVAGRRRRSPSPQREPRLRLSTLTIGTGRRQTMGVNVDRRLAGFSRRSSQDEAVVVGAYADAWLRLR